MAATFGDIGPRRPLQTANPAAGTQNYRVKLLSAVNSMPPLPTVLSRLIGMLNSEMYSAVQVAAVIEKDSVLSGSVLRCVNSAYYGLPGRVSSIRQAVTLLGFKTIRNLALAFSMRRMMTQAQPSKKAYSAYSRHALAGAVMTQFLAHYSRSPEVEAAFAAGLFHDVGKLLILSTIPDVVPLIVEKWEYSDEPYYEAERAILEITHPELSAIVLEGWKLPDAILHAARYHHDPESHPEAGGGTTLAHLVQAADATVDFEGLSAAESTKRQPEPPHEFLRSLGVGDASEQLMQQFKQEFAGMQTIFQ